MEKTRRKNMRIPGFDYSKGSAYFITLCTYERAYILSEVQNDNAVPEICLSQLGIIASNMIREIETRYRNVRFDSWVIMPNHIHFIVFLKNEPGVTPAIGRVIGAYKSLVVKKWRDMCNENDQFSGKIWQRNYYEHIVRDEQDLSTIRRYIAENPYNWENDELY